ncbi:acetyl-CoA carboxylase biotin carboxyl carrier protein [Clostridium sp. BJN0001]|uniref:acetyl-CoA carboxylase biotin carboxyl carrier protein n=1 Tax=Clostridium sp. BJN0001 TaxID=2930219 RepID=UPI001FD0B73E|nr:acetyl-CoA carboxylase biotin carboxyl carrier protein [Clostridium sp. BJN0001]
MDFEKVKELINIIDSSKLAFLELKNGEDYIKIDKSLTRGTENNKVSSDRKCEETSEKLSKSIEKSSDNTDEEDVKPEEKKSSEENSYTKIKSPMVGTFYSKASPESDSFVKEGDKVSKGKVICIIEAMKLMNEIESEYDGIIKKCLIKDGDMVEYGQPIFEVEEDK